MVGLLALQIAFRQLSGAAEDPAPAQVEGPPCTTGDTVLVTSCFNVPMAANTMTQNGPSVVVVHAGSAGESWLATLAQTGAVWGLGERPATDHIYAAAYHKRGEAFGPAGPGAIYRLSLGALDVAVAGQVPNPGPDKHASGGSPGSPDEAARNWAGKTSLGDLDVAEDGAELYVTNLFERRIHRYQLPDMQPLGSFDHGAAAEPWAEDARPFALALRQGRLYHGVVDSAESSQDPGRLAAYVYSSNRDGSDMRQVLAVPLSYPRGEARVRGVIQGSPFEDVPLAWQAWRDGYHVVKAVGQAVYPQPLLADIEFDADGNMLLGLRDRMSDMTLNAQWQVQNQIEKPGLGIGDLLFARRSGEAWVASLPTGALGEAYGDRSSVADSSVLGGLARRSGLNEIAAASLLPSDVNAGSGQDAVSALTQFRNPDGSRTLRRNVACAVPYFQVTPIPLAWPGGVELARAHSEWLPSADLGDVEEAVCGMLPTVTPTATATRPPSATPTASATRTPTRTPSPTATSTATPTPGPIYLPTLLGEACTPEQQHVDVVLVLDASSSMLDLTLAGRPKIQAAREAARTFIGLLDPDHDQAAVVWFNAGAGIAQRLTADQAALGRALDAITVEEYTRIHLGLDQAAAVLAGPERKSGNAAVVVMLTDGRSNPDPAQTAVDAAARLKAAGATLFTIGLGRELDEWALQAMASEPAAFRRAADGEELAGIYRQIARELPCPAQDFFPWRPPSAGRR